MYRANWLDSETDSFANTGVRDPGGASGRFGGHQIEGRVRYWIVPKLLRLDTGAAVLINGRFLNDAPNANGRSEEHTSELQSLMRITYAVLCLKKKKTNT